MCGRKGRNPPFCRAGQDSLHAGDGAGLADSQGEKGLFCKIIFHDLQKQGFFMAWVLKFAGKTLLGVTGKQMNYAKRDFCIIGEAIGCK